MATGAPEQLLAPVETARRRHGRAKYIHERCRCEVCSRANRDYERHRTRQRGLQAAGMGWRRVATLAGVHRSVVGKVLYGDRTRNQAPSKRTSPVTAAKLLAVTAELDQLSAGAAVPAVGTHRRLQALVAAGWTQARLAARLGIDQSNFATLLGQPAVRVATARAVRALYEQLWDTPPPSSTSQERTAANRARNRAHAVGWAPPMAWDDGALDDPTATAATANDDEESLVDDIVVERVLAGTAAGRKLTPAERQAVADHVRAAGGTVTELTHRLKCSGAIARQLLGLAS